VEKDTVYVSPATDRPNEDEDNTIQKLAPIVSIASDAMTLKIHGVAAASQQQFCF